MLLLTLIFYSLLYNTRNTKANYVFYAASTFLGILMLFSFAVVAYFVGTIWVSDVDDDTPFFGKGADPHPTFIMVGVAISFGGYIFPVLFNMHKVWELIKCLPHFIYFTPSYIHTLVIYAFTRIDDLSWGTKGLEADKDDTKTVFLWKKYEWVYNIFIYTIIKLIIFFLF